ncbi:MAG: hypothetical protein AB1485_04350 [Candidatus Thermoplasmatota archaeon]
MIIEETTFSSLLAICSSPIPTTVHRYKGVYFGIAHIGDALYLAISRDAPRSEAPYIEYDSRDRTYRFVDPRKDTFSRSPTAIVIPIIEVKELSGELGEKIKSILSK